MHHNEVEIKYRVGTRIQSLRRQRHIIKELGFTVRSRRIETDFLPDTVDGACKKSGTLLRLRRVSTPSQNSLLLTVKRRQQDKDILFFHESEVDLGQPAKDTSTRNYIIDTVLSVTGIDISPALNTPRNLEYLVRHFSELGLSKRRILLDKYREEYIRDTIAITLDYFPDSMGAFVEVEAASRDALIAVMNELPYHEKQIVTDDYGDILKAHKSTLSKNDQRTAVFTKKRRTVLLEEKD